MKANRFAVAVLLVGLSLLLEASPTFALPQPLRPRYPWKTEYINQSNDISSISMILDENHHQPQAFHYKNDLLTLNKATLVGNGSGNCGSQSNWWCNPLSLPNGGGKNLDSAYYIGAAGKSFLAGIVYFDLVDLRLTYLEVTGTDPAVTPDIIDFGSFSGTVTSKLVYGPDGSPHVVILVDKPMFESDQMVYIHRRASPPGSCAFPPWNGNALWDCEVIIQGFEVAEDPSIALDDAGDVHIAYYDPIDDNLVYATNAGARGGYICNEGNSWRCIIVESVGDTGAFPSIAAGSRPYIAYYNRTTGKLRLAEWVAYDGNCGSNIIGLEQTNSFQCEEIDAIGSSRLQVAISLALDIAEPVISYSEATGPYSRLRLAQRSQRIGLPIGNCGELSPGDTFLHWQCDIIAQGPYDLGGEIDLAINPSGMANIAYLEDDDHEMQNHLWAAYQYIPKHVYLPLLRR